MTFDLLTLKVVSESRVTWATSVQILVFLDLSVLELRPIYATDRQTSDRQTSDVRKKHRLMPPPYGGGGIIMCDVKSLRAGFYTRVIDEIGALFDAPDGHPAAHSINVCLAVYRCMPYEMSRDFSHPVSFHVMLSVSVAAPPGYGMV